MTVGVPEFRILGPLEAVTEEGGSAELGGPKQRELLALLLLYLNRVVPAPRLVEALWPEPGTGSQVTLRTHVSHLRRRLAAIGAEHALVTRPPGYGLLLNPRQLDAARFERLLRLGHDALGLGEPGRAADQLGEALALWRGPVLDDLGPPEFAEAEAARLGELRLAALEARIDADLRQQRHLDLVAELEHLVAAHPFRERFAGQLMLALYRSGRQVDALAVHSATRDRLADELGLDVGPELARLESAILRHDPALLPPSPTQPERARRRPAEPLPDALFAAARRTPMVGRTKELDQLRALWGATVDGGRRAVLLSGEAGVGKTRLVAELAQLAAADGASTLVGRCDPVAAGPYHPVAAAIRSCPAAEEALADAPEALRARLATFLEGSSAQPSSGPPTRPSSAAADSPPEHRAGQSSRAAGLPGATAGPSSPGAGLPAGPRARPAPPDAGPTSPRTGSAGGRRARTSPPEERGDEQLQLFNAVQWLLAGIAESAPVLFVIEEAERIDHGSSRLLRHLLGRLPRNVLLVIGFRDPPGSRHHPLLELLGDLPGPGVADRLVLRPLAEADVRSLVASLAAGAPEEMARDLWQRTGGNPFFVTEVLRDLNARGELHSTTWRAPPRVTDVLRHRLQDLPEPAGHVVSAAATLGGKAEFGLLSALVEETEDTVVDALDQAIGAGLLIEAGSSWVSSYAFPHELMRDAVYADIPGPRRQRLHLRAAQALLRSGTDIAAAAVHMRAAGPAADPLRAAELSLRAADEADRRCAWDAAIEHAEAAAEILGHVGAPPAEQADAAINAARLRLKSGIGFPQAIRHLESAIENHRGDDIAVAAVHSRLGTALSAYHPVMDIPRAIEHFAAAERLLAGPRALAHLHRGRAQAAMFGLHTELLGTSSRQAGELASLLGRRDLGVAAGWGLGWFHVNRGELVEAFGTFDKIWATAHELGDPYLGWPPVNAAALCATVYLLDPAQSRQWCRRGLVQAGFASFAHQHAAVVDQLALAQAEMGELAAARRTVAALPDGAVSRRSLTFLDGEWERAERAWAEALATDEAAGDRHDAALNARWLATVRFALGRPGEAVDALHLALEIAVDGPQVPTELAVRAELARALATAETAEPASVLGAGESTQAARLAGHLGAGASGVAIGRARAAGALAESTRHLARCEEILADGEDWRGALGLVELARGALAAAQGKRAESDAAYERAVEIFTVFHLPWRRAGALRSWAGALDAAGEHATARERRAGAARVYDEIGAAPRWPRS